MARRGNPRAAGGAAPRETKRRQQPTRQLKTTPAKNSSYEVELVMSVCPTVSEKEVEAAVVLLGDQLKAILED